MARYFEGRVEVLRKEFDEGAATLNCAVFERWEDIDLSTTARCGDTASIEISRVAGLTHKESEKLKATIGSSVGIPKLAEVKSGLESELAKELTWHETESVKQTVTFTAPKCGNRTDTIYQLVRDYEFAYSRPRLLRAPRTWQKSMTERTTVYDVRPLIEEWDPECKCPLPSQVVAGGTAVFDFGAGSLRTPCTFSDDGATVRFEDDVRQFNMGQGDVLKVDVLPSALPESLRFLCGLESEPVSGELRIETPYSVPSGDMADEIVDLMGLLKTAEEEKGIRYLRFLRSYWTESQEGATVD